MITVLVDTFYLKAAPAGIKTYITQLIYSSKISKSKNIKYIYTYEINKKNTQAFLNSKNRLIRWLFQIKYFVWKQIVLPIKCVIYKPDILLCPDYILPFWKLNLKKVVVLHDALFWKNKEDYSMLWRLYYLKSINLGIDNNTLIVTTSQFSKNSLKKVLRKKNNIEIIYQSCSEKLFKDNSKTEKQILHVGSFEKRKNLMTLVKAFSEIKLNPLYKDFKLILVGSTNFFGNKSEFNFIKDFISKNNLKTDVAIRGHLSDKKIRKLYSKAFMYVFPSKSEGFGIPIIESFLAKLPVVCSDIEVFQEIGKDAVLFFDKNNHLDLASKIELVIQSKELRKELINKGSKRVKLFSNQNFINSYEKLFNSIL